MATTDVDIKIVEEPKAQIEPPQPGAPRTITIPTVSPHLVPDEDATAYCLTRRNVIDIVIALLLAAGIIYLVMFWKRGRMMMPLSGLMTQAPRRAAASGFQQGIRQGARQGVRGAQGALQQFGGILKKIFF